METGQIDMISSYLQEHQTEQYPICNELLAVKDEYTKSIYFRLLCTLIRYAEEPNEMQVLFMNRLIFGCRAERSYPEYMQMSMELKKQDIDGFIYSLKQNDLKYYFCIDGCILLTLGNGPEQRYELLVKCVEILGITRPELRYLALVSRAVLAQSSDMLDQAKEQATESTENLSLNHYLAGFYNGLLVNSKERIHFYSCCHARMDLSHYPILTAKTVILEGISAELISDLQFQNCEIVIIRDVHMKVNDFCFAFDHVRTVRLENSVFEQGKKNAIAFHNCLDVQITNSQFLDFSCRTITEENVSSFTIQDSIFENCMYQYRHSHMDWSSFACVIYTSDPNANGRNILQHCSFINCGGKNLNTSKSSDILSNCISRLINCTFTNCWHYNYYGLDPDNRDRKMFRWDTEVENCHVINSARIN